MKKYALFLASLAFSVAGFAAPALQLAVSEGTSDSGTEITTAQIAQKYKPITDALSRALGRPVQAQYVREFSTLETGMRNGTYDMVLARPSDYPSRGVRDYGYKAVTASKPDGQCILVVRKDSPIKDAKGLKGRRIILPEEPAYMTKFCLAALRDLGYASNDYISEYVREQSIIPSSLKEGLTNAGGIASYSGAAKKLEENNLRVLHLSTTQPFMPLIASKRLSAEQIQAMRQALVQLASTPEGKESLKPMQIEGFDPQPEARMLNLLNWLEGK